MEKPFKCMYFDRTFLYILLVVDILNFTWDYTQETGHANEIIVIEFSL